MGAAQNWFPEQIDCPSKSPLILTCPSPWLKLTGSITLIETQGLALFDVWGGGEACLREATGWLPNLFKVILIGDAGKEWESQRISRNNLWRLYEATRRQEDKLEWTPEIVIAFNNLRKSMLEALTLALLNTHKQFNLFVDERKGIEKELLTQLWAMKEMSDIFV